MPPVTTTVLAPVASDCTTTCPGPSDSGHGAVVTLNSEELSVGA